MTAGDQKEAFNTLVEETLGETCDYQLVKNIHEQLTAMIEEKKDEPEPLALDKYEVRTLLEASGADTEKWKPLTIILMRQPAPRLPSWFPT